MNKLRFLLLLAVSLIPLIGAFGDFGYEQIKVLFFILSISLIGFIWLLNKPKIKWSKVKIASLIFILLLLLTSLVGIDAKQSIFGSDPYFQGWLIYAYLFLFSIIISSFEIKLLYYGFTLTASALVVSLLAIEDWILKNLLDFSVPNYADRVVSTFGQPNFYAGFLLLSLPFAYLLLKSSSKKLQIFALISGLILMLGILASSSRTAILMGFSLIILGLICELKMKSKFGAVVVGVIIISIFIALKFSLGIVGKEVSQPLITRNPDLTKESVEKRVYIWPQAFNIVLQKPLTGYGLENIGESFAGYFIENKHVIFEENLQIYPVLISLKDLNIDRSHNYILDLLLFSGLLGLLGWLGLLGMLFKRLRQTLHGRYMFVHVVSLVAYLIWTQFQNQSIVHLIYFWLLVGLIDRGSIDKGL